MRHLFLDEAEERASQDGDPEEAKRVQQDLVSRLVLHRLPQPVGRYLEPSFLDAELRHIDRRKASAWPPPQTGAGDTIWMGAADASGLAVSYIQSLYWEFGSGVVLPATGVLMQNRGASFSLERGALNELAPGRRPFHTLNPALAVTAQTPQDQKEERKGFGWWYWSRAWLEHQNLRDERAEAFTSLLREGVYNYSYITRATTPGVFVVPPAKAEEMYHPETFGRGATDRVVIE